MKEAARNDLQETAGPWPHCPARPPHWAAPGPTPGRTPGFRAPNTPPPGDPPTAGGGEASSLPHSNSVESGFTVLRANHLPRLFNFVMAQPGHVYLDPALTPNWSSASFRSLPRGLLPCGHTQNRGPHPPFLVLLRGARPSPRAARPEPVRVLGYNLSASPRHTSQGRGDS